MILIIIPFYVAANGDDGKDKESADKNKDDPTDLNKIIGKPDDRFEEVPTNFQNIDLFSGEINENIPLVSLQGRNGMDFSLALSYSSNYDAKKENKEQPTSWAGLGWNLGFGSISAETKGTSNFEDDTFYFNNEKLIKIPNTKNQYKLKNYRYINIYRVDDGKKITSWVIIREDGSMEIYGDNDNAISYMISKGDWIGSVFNGETELTPYAWHLYKQIAIFGNEITYEYDKVEEYLKSESWQSTYPYTKAIYPKKVTDSIGREIIFNTQSKETDEYYNPYPFAEPDSYMEFYEDKFLDYILVKNKNKDGTLSNFQKIEFDYSMVGSGQLRKRLLNSITTSFYDDGNLCSVEKEDVNWCPMPKTEFNYYPLTDQKPASLKKIAHPTGGTTEYTYQEKELMYTQLDGSIEQGETEVAYLGNNYMVVKYGTVQQNNNYFLKKFSEAKSFSVYNWDGHKWTDKQDFGIDTKGTRNLNIYTGPDYFLVRPLLSDEFIMYQRHGDKWEEETRIKFDHKFELIEIPPAWYTLEKEISVYPLENNIFIVYGKTHSNLKVYHKKINEQNKIEWKQVSLPKDSFSGYAKLWPTDRYFVVRYERAGDRIDVYNWENNQWVKKNDWAEIPGSAFDITTTDDYFIVRDGNKKLNLFEYDGNSWQLKQQIESNYGKNTAAGENFFIRTGEKDVELFKRKNNHKWEVESGKLFSASSGHKIVSVFANDKYIGIVTRKEFTSNDGIQFYDYYYTIFNKINENWIKRRKTNILAEQEKTNPCLLVCMSQENQI